MKTFKTKAVIIVGVAVLGLTSAADFINLDFEMYSGSGPNLLPGWERGTNNYMWPLIDSYPISTAGLGLVTTNGGALSGKYSLFFCPGHEAGGTPGQPFTLSVWQTAQVPNDAVQLSFTVAYDMVIAPITYSFTLGPIDLLANSPEILSNGASRFTATISSLAGQEATLTFSATTGQAAWHRIDDINITSIPEPSTGILLVIAMLSLLMCKGIPTTACTAYAKPGAAERNHDELRGGHRAG